MPVILIHIIYIVEHVLVLTEPSSGRRKFQVEVKHPETRSRKAATYF